MAQTNEITKEMKQYAFENGITDKSYPTVRYGWITAYRGQVVRKYKDEWMLITGHDSSGTPDIVTREGRITFRRLLDLNYEDKRGEGCYYPWTREMVAEECSRLYPDIQDSQELMNLAVYLMSSGSYNGWPENITNQVHIAYRAMYAQEALR